MTVETKEVEYIYDDEHPLAIYFLPSGFPNKTIMVTEDPFDGVESRLISDKEKKRIIGINSVLTDKSYEQSGN